jgi:uncharacterized protein
MDFIRVRGTTMVRILAGALLLLASGICEPAYAQYYYRGFGFSFFGNPWFFNPRPAPPERRAPRPREHREHEAAPNVTSPPPPQKAEVAPAKTGIVLGDSMAEWLAYGLEQAYAESHQVGVVRKTRSGTALLDACKGDARKWIEQAIGNEKPAFIAVMVGMNDRRSTPACGSAKAEDSRPTSLPFRSKEWAEAYGKEVDEVIALLKSKGAPVFWVGLPPARNVRAADVGFLNDVFREHADKNGIGYIDVWDGFVDEDGDFTMRGPDVNGQRRLLRAADGLNFTKAGARKLALSVEREVSRTVLHPAPVETPPVASEGAGQAPGKPNERPAAGPVVPLTQAPRSARDDTLLGGKPVHSSADSKLLGGEPVTPARGRADDFSWPRPESNAGAAQETPGFAQDNSGAAQGGSDAAESGKPRPRAAKRKAGEKAH